MSQKLVYIVSGFVGGIFLRSFLDFGWAVIGLFLVVGLAFLAQKNFRIALLCVGLVLGIARYNIHDQTGELLVSAGEQTLEVLIIDEADEREKFIRYNAEVRPRKDGGLTSATTKIAIVARTSPIFNYGDLVSVSGKVEEVRDEYLNKDEIYYEIAFPQIKLISHDQGSPIKAKLFAFKHAFLDRIGRVIPEPESSLAGGLVVGAKQSLGEDLLTRFRSVGLIHVIVLSGYNLTLIADFIKNTLGVILPITSVTWLSAIAIILFAILAGAGATVVRATIMALLVLVARSTGRVYDVTRALVIAGLIMLVHNPKVLVFDVGFQLSFLATLGLLYLEPIIATRLTRLPEKILIFKFRETIAATLAAQAAVLPLILYEFGNLSLYALPANILVLPVVPYTMLLVFLTGLVGFVFYPLSLLISFPAYALLAYQLFVTRIFSNLPLANINIKSFPLIFVLLMYASLVFIVLKYRKKEQHLEVKPPSA